MDKNIPRLFVSSTVRDLGDYRSAAAEIARAKGFAVVLSEDFDAVDARPLDECLERVRECDLVIAIVAHWCGFRPAGQGARPGKSITRLECEAADEARDADLVSFLVDPKAEWPDEHREEGRAARAIRQGKCTEAFMAEVQEGFAALRDFKSWLGDTRIVASFANLSDFKLKLTNALEEWKKRRLTPPAADSSLRQLDDPEWREPRELDTYTLLYGRRFVARPKWGEMLTQWVERKDPETAGISTLCLYALGGGGKSALTWNWFQDIKAGLRDAGYGGAFWCSFYRQGFHFQDFLEALVDYIGIDLPKEVDPARHRRNMEVYLREALNQAPLLIVLDGLEREMKAFADDAAKAIDDDQQDERIERGDVDWFDRKLLNEIDGKFLQSLLGSRSRILISSRIEPADLEERVKGAPHDGAMFVQLGGFSEKQALRFWSDCGLSGTETDLVRMFRSFGMHPLIIGVLANSVAQSASRGDFDAWRRENEDFDPYETTELMTPRRRRILEVATRDLEERGWVVLESIAMVSEASSYPVLHKVLVETAGEFTDSELRAKLGELHGRGLVGRDPAEQVYDVHPVVRGLVWKRLKDPERAKNRRDPVIKVLESEAAAPPEDVKAPEHLNGTIQWYRLRVQAGERDRAWDTFRGKIWPLLYVKFSDAELSIRLLSMLFPRNEHGAADFDALPMLQKREDQAASLSRVGQLRQQMGQDVGATMRRASALHLLAGSDEEYLRQAQNALWGELYQGRMFAVEGRLREVANRATEKGFGGVAAGARMWLGLVAALGLRRREARALLGEARRELEADSRRWVLQCIAEAELYMGRAEPALELLNQILESAGDREPLEDWGGQWNWEMLSLGMALCEVENQLGAEHALSAARQLASRRKDKVIECFALAWLARLELKHDHLERALEHLDHYDHVDPDGSYRFSAAEAYRLRAELAFAEQRQADGLAYAERAYRAAYCDGPPFSFEFFRVQARDLLRFHGGKVPRPRKAVPGDWQEALPALADVPERRKKARSKSRVDVSEPRPRRWIYLSPDRQAKYELAVVMNVVASALAESNVQDRLAACRAKIGESEASEPARRWWQAVAATNLPRKMIALVESMIDAGADIQSLFDAVAAQPDEVDLATLILRSPESRTHDSAIDRLMRWYESEEARPKRSAYEMAALTDSDLRAFLSDAMTRLGVDGSGAAALRLWSQLQTANGASPTPLLVLSEVLRESGIAFSELAAAWNGRAPLGDVLRSLRSQSSPAGGPPRGITNTKGWTDERVRERLDETLKLTDFDDCPPAAREWWGRFEHENKHRLALVLRLVEELSLRQQGVHELHLAHERGETDNIQAVLCFMDYSTIEALGEDFPRGVPESRLRSPTVGTTDAADWPEDAVREKHDAVARSVGVADAPPAARSWLTQALGGDLRAELHVFEQLLNRSSTLTELYAAHDAGNTRSVVSTLHFLDHQRFAEAERQKRAKAAEDAARERRRSDDPPESQSDSGEETEE